MHVSAISTIRPHPGERHPAASGDREAPSGLRLLDLLATMVEERPTVTIGTVDGEAVTGELRAVGGTW